jgi:hypothetical protein
VQIRSRVQKSENPTSINELLSKTGMWQASRIGRQWQQGISSGFPDLDRLLPGNGWPKDGLTELLHDMQGIGELRLVLPALSHLSRDDSRWIVWASPPFIPYAPGLARAGIDLSSILLVYPDNHKDLLWVLEKALASGTCSAVLGWPKRIREKELRRLQVAGKEGNTWGVMFRDTRCMDEASPAELRVSIKPNASSPLSWHSSASLSILKRRGGWATDIAITFNDYLNQITPDFRELTTPHMHRVLVDNNLPDLIPEISFEPQELKLQ